MRTRSARRNANRKEEKTEPKKADSVKQEDGAAEEVSNRISELSMAADVQTMAAGS